MTCFLFSRRWFHAMRDVTLISLCWFVVPVWANDPQHIYRCGNTYTNQPDPKQSCTLLRNTGQRVIVIEGTRTQGPQGGAPNAGVLTAKVDSTDQRQRDTQAQTVLQAELQRAQKQHAELLREWNRGEPERRDHELREPQKYQDRVAQLRGAIQRVEADVAGLQRELSRLPVPVQTGAKP
jgi:hypothetical protein